MRKIKFRMWDTEEKCFMNHSRVIESRVLALENNGEGRFIFHQWTGLLDRYGREIYEGDIVKIESHTVGLIDGVRKSEKPKVKYRRIGWHPNGSWNSYRTLSNEHVGIVSVYKPEKWCEVVGNIYEHQHLLEGDIHE